MLLPGVMRRSHVRYDSRKVRVATSMAFISVLIAGCSTGTNKASASTSSSSSATTAAPTTTTSRPRPAFSLSDIRHVFVIVLENESYSDTFGTASDDPYLASTLVSQGALLSNFYAIGHHSADNYIAMISGQPPTIDTQDDSRGFRKHLRTVERRRDRDWRRLCLSIGRPERGHPAECTGSQLEGLHAGHGQHLFQGVSCLRASRNRRG